MKAIVVGTGGATRELLRRLGEGWELTVIEQNRERLEQARGIRALRPILGDGTSRLVLERAGLREANAIVAATSNDEANLEICRLAKEAGLSRIIAVAAEPERLAAYRELGVSAISPDTLVTRRIEEDLETRRYRSRTFAHGRAEAIEFEIAPGSPVRGRRLADLHARSWVVGTILRGDQLLIPHGDTVLEAGDLVTVVGAGTDFAQIMRTFSATQPHFPLDYGQTVAVAVQESDVERVVPEAAGLVRRSRAVALLLAYRDPAGTADEEEAARRTALLERAIALAGGVDMRRRAVAGPLDGELLRLAREESIGVLVRTAPEGSWMRGLWRVHKSVELARKTSRPVLLSRATQPWRRILVPARRTDAGRAAARAAIDIAARARATLHAVVAVDPIFIGGPDAMGEGRLAIEWLREEAALLGLELTTTIRRGNPIRLIEETSREAELLVIGIARKPVAHPFPTMVAQLAARARTSVLLVPAIG